MAVLKRACHRIAGQALKFFPVPPLAYPARFPAVFEIPRDQKKSGKKP